MSHSYRFTRNWWCLMHKANIVFYSFSARHVNLISFNDCISMGECNAILSAYRHLEQYCSHPSIYDPLSLTKYLNPLPDDKF